MKRFAICAALALLFVAPALAQPPEELTADDTIDMEMGQSKIVQFDKSVAKVLLSGKNVVEITPQNDRTFTIGSLGYGSVIAIAYDPDGKEISRMNIVVAGHMVKIYGLRVAKRDAAATPGTEYDGYMCTDRGCGRVNPDLESAPSSTSVADTQPGKDGSSRTVTKTYR